MAFDLTAANAVLKEDYIGPVRDQLNNDNYFVFCGKLIFVFTKTPAGFLFTEVGAND